MQENTLWVAKKLFEEVADSVQIRRKAHRAGSFGIAEGQMMMTLGWREAKALFESRRAAI